MTRVWINGVNGFIGRNLAENLKEYNLTTKNRQELDLLDEKRVKNFLNKEKFDFVIHTANYDASQPQYNREKTQVLEKNIRMFFNIARCKDSFGKMIYFGSGAEFNREHWIPHMDENYFDCYVPKDQYGFSKYLMTKYALKEENIINLRLFGVFGKYEDPRVRIISNLCVQAMLNKPLIIKENRKYDFMDVKDLTKIVKWAIEENPKNKVYNVCTGKAIKFSRIAEIIKNISNKKLEIKIENETNIEYSGDNSLLMSEMKGFSFTKLNDSITELYGWYNGK